MTVKFKNNDIFLRVNGIGIVDQSNITPELYARLLQQSDKYAEYFEVTGAPEPEPVQEKKSKKQLNQKADE